MAASLLLGVFEMRSFWKSDLLATSSLACKRGLAAGGVIALLLMGACGDDKDDTASTDTTTITADTVAVDPAQAPIIQKSIENWVRLYWPETNGSVHYSAIKVTPGSDSFDVAIEELVIGEKNGQRLEVGTVGYKLTPTAADTFIVSDVTHASDMVVKGANNEDEGTVTLTTKTLTGEWSPALLSFLSLDWQAADITATEKAENGSVFSIVGLSGKISSVDKGNGLFDQNSLFEMTAFKAGEKDGESLEIGKLNITGLMNRIKMKEYTEKAREVQSIATEITNREVDGSSQAPDMNSAQAQKLGTLIKDIFGLIGGMNYGMSITDVSFKEKDGNEPFRLGEGKFNFGFADLDKEKATVNLDLSHSNLAIKDLQNLGLATDQALLAKFLPASSTIDIDLTEVPVKDLWAAFGSNLPQLTSTDPAQSSAAEAAMLVAVQQLLQKSPMKLIVAPSNISAEIMQVDATGDFDVKPEAAMGAVGALNVSFHGLEQAVSTLKEFAKTSPDALQMIGVLAMIQSLAKKETGSDGQPVDKLEVKVDAAGNTTVNGQPLSGM